jgi:hypothetical protein
VHCVQECCPCVCSFTECKMAVWEKDAAVQSYIAGL